MKARQFMIRTLRRLTLRFWHDDRGNLGILLLLTIWALVLLVAMVWNTGEFATRRRHVQAAADSAAQSASLWTARTTNLTTSANLVMSQNGSAEVILRSIVPTRDQIQTRLDREGDRARQLQHGNRQGEPEQGVPDCEYFEELIGFGAWAGNGRGQKRQQDLQKLTPAINRALQEILPLLQPQQAQQLSQSMQDGLSQNQIALGWILDTYIGNVGGGGATGTPPATPPAFTPVGQPVSDWITNDVRPRLADILRTLEVEQSWHDRWIAQTAPALATTPEQLREVRFEIFDYEQQIRDLTPDVVREQHEALSDFYKVRTTTSVPGRESSDPQGTPVTAPVSPAASVEGEVRIDSIRQRYPDATARRFGTSSPQVWIDPINVNVEQSEIWHPGRAVPVTGITLEGETYSGWISVGGGSWGRVPCAPLNRYVNDRVYRDREGLRAEPRAIDQERTALRGRIYPPPGPPTIAQLPQETDVDDAQGNPIRLPPRSIPTLPLPQELTPQIRAEVEALNEQIRAYNRDLRDYVNDLRGLPDAADRMLDNLSGHSDSATRRFADQTWLNHVDRNRDLVLRLMGNDKHFMVLATYELRDVPDWASDDMRQDVYRHVYNLLMSRSRGSATQRLIRQLEQWAIGVLGAANPPGSPGRNTIRSRARRFAQQYGPPAAANATRRAADIIAREVASEWVRRPWPYEIEPPTEPVPPTRGISDLDRKRYFTSLSASLTTDDTGARPTLGQYFGHDTGPMVAFAQSDIFNWMEFNEGYGGGDRYDRITFYGHGDMGGSPRPWRLGSPGGWNWEPRLSLSDALAQAIADGEQFRNFFEEGGVTADGQSDAEAIELLATH